MATMEPENETQEMQQYFHNLSDSRSMDMRYNQTEGGRAVAYLDASRGRDYGPVWSKELAQGDSLHAAVLGMLYDPKEKPKMRDLLLGVGKQNSLLTSGIENASMTGTSSLGLQPLWLALQLARQLEKAPLPESYLGYILYDQDSVRYDSGRVEISRQAFTNPEELALDITATQGGFVEVYVYNGSDLPVWYDQFSISSTQAVIIQENHYYPFGMQIAGLELDLDSRNRYLYNGKELQDDHNLDWHDYGARMYDAQIGRFHRVDRFSDKYFSISPYQYGRNNPLLFIDVNGDSTIYYNSSGNQLWVSNDGLENALTIIDDNNILSFFEQLGKNIKNNQSSDLRGFGTSYMLDGLESRFEETKSDTQHPQGGEWHDGLSAEHGSFLYENDGDVRIGNEDFAGGPSSIIFAGKNDNDDYVGYYHTHPNSGRRDNKKGGTHQDPPSQGADRNHLGKRGYRNAIVTPNNIYLYNRGQKDVVFDRKKRFQE